MCVLYSNEHQTLNTKKFDRGQIRFREYSITPLQPKAKENVTDQNFFLHIQVLEDFPNNMVYDTMRFCQNFTIHDFHEKFARPQILA